MSGAGGGRDGGAHGDGAHGGRAHDDGAHGDGAHGEGAHDGRMQDDAAHAGDGDGDGVRAVGLAVLYRWRLLPGREAEFEAAWREATRALLARGSLGSRLHRGEDGLWYGYAQWPDAQARRRAFADADAGAADGPAARMRACVAESFPETRLAPVADLLRLPHNAGS